MLRGDNRTPVGLQEWASPLPIRNKLASAPDVDIPGVRRDVKTHQTETVNHRRSQDFVWGELFFSKKVDDLFLVVALKTDAT